MSISNRRLLTDEDVDREIDEMLLEGRAQTVSEAENAWLDAHLEDIALLAEALDDRAFSEHVAVQLLMSYGSRKWDEQ